MSKHHGIVAMLLGALGVLAASASARADSMSDSMPDSMDPAPPAPTPASVCTASFSLGSPTSCKPRALWTEYAKKECAGRGYPAVGSFSLGNACWKGFRSVEYTCCN